MFVSTCSGCWLLGIGMFFGHVEHQTLVSAFHLHIIQIEKQKHINTNAKSTCIKYKADSIDFLLTCSIHAISIQFKLIRCIFTYFVFTFPLSLLINTLMYNIFLPFSLFVLTLACNINFSFSASIFFFCFVVVVVAFYLSFSSHSVLPRIQKPKFSSDPYFSNVFGTVFTSNALLLLKPT